MPFSINPNASTPANIAQLEAYQAFLQTSDVDDYNWFSTNSVYILLVIVVLAYLIEKGLAFYLKEQFASHKLRNQRNLVCYVIEVLFMLIGLIITLGWVCALLSRNMDNLFNATPTHIELFRFTALALSLLYLWELSYRIDMNWQLTLHHFLTILLIIMYLHSLMDTGDIYFMGSGVCLLLTAWTEPLVFVALFMYRLNIKHRGYVLKFSSVQTAICKVWFSLWAMVLVAVACFSPRENTGVIVLDFSNGWYTAWKVLMWFAFPALMFTQLYGCYILWIISLKKKAQEEHVAEVHA